MKRFILIDFENVQKIDLGLVDTQDTEIIIFVGKSQSKIPFALVQKTQKLGDRVRWLKIAGDGKNNLDFHIAFELGRLREKHARDTSFVILSKDSGYDSLIRYVSESGVPVKRIANLAELSDSKKQLPRSRFTQDVLANLGKISSKKLPRTRGTLKKHIESLLRDRANPGEIDEIIEEMFVTGRVSEANNRLRYKL
jgi:hypothetical protein